MPLPSPYEWHEWYPSDDQSVVTRWASLEDVADDWWVSDRTGLGGVSPVWEFVDDVMRRGAQEALPLLQLLVDRALDEMELGLLGAGVIEDLISHFGHGSAFIDELIEHMRRDPRFAAAVKGAVLADDVPTDVQDKLAVWIDRP